MAMEDIILKYMAGEISLKEVASLVEEGNFSEEETQQLQKAVSLKALTGFSSQKQYIAIGLSSLKKFNKPQNISIAPQNENKNFFSLLWKYAAVASIAIILTLVYIKFAEEPPQSEKVG